MVDCEKNSYAPEGEPLHQIVEEFADNQEAWFKVIDPTYLLSLVIEPKKSIDI